MFVYPLMSFIYLNSILLSKSYSINLICLIIKMEKNSISKKHKFEDEKSIDNSASAIDDSISSNITD